MTTTTAYLTLSLFGHETEHRAEVKYRYTPATGDGWNEPRYPASVELRSVHVPGYQHDLLPLLSPECITRVCGDLLQEHEESLKPDPDYLRDMREEWA